jgi:hypothetical protein
MKMYDVNLTARELAEKGEAELPGKAPLPLEPARRLPASMKNDTDAVDG